MGGSSIAALSIACLLPHDASAGSYTAENEAELRQAIELANDDGDLSATITLTDDITITDPGAFPAFAKPVTIDTGAFTLAGASIASGEGDGTSLTFSGGDLLTAGNFQGGSADPAPNTGFAAGVGGTGIVLSNGSLENSGAITGGNGGGRLRAPAGAGGSGVDLTDSTLTNLGDIAGGQGGELHTGSGASVPNGRRAGAGGTGVIMVGGSLDNQGTITAGDGGDATNTIATTDNFFGGIGGTGADLTGGSHTNSGSITGGAGGTGRNSIGSGSGSGPGGNGIVLSDSAIFINDGVIAGGEGKQEAHTARGSAGGDGAVVTDSNLVNNHTISGGDGAGGTGSGNSGSISNGRGGTGATLTNSTATNAGIIVGGTGGGAAASAAGVARGGHGLTLEDSTITNTGTIAGGTGGLFDAASGIGGVGVTGTGGANVITSGTISGGLSGDEEDRNNAVTFTNGGNRLELRAGYLIEGDVVATAAGGDTLVLGGGTNSTFDVSLIGPTEQYQNFETFEKRGASTWMISGIATEASPWDIYEGTMMMSAGSDLGDGTVNVFADMLAGVGTVGPTIHHADGTIAPGIDGIGTLTIDGDYTGQGGLLDIETVLGDDSSATDLLVVNGDTSGTTNVQVTNVGGPGAQTVEGIKIVDVGAASNGTFSLLGDYDLDGQQAVVAGAYAYTLQQNGITEPTDGDWYLRSALINAEPLYQAGVPVYEAYAGALQGFNTLGTLQQRVGNRSWAAPAGDHVEGSGVWARIDVSHGSFEPEKSTSSADYDATAWTLQAGLDVALAETAAGGRLIGGLTGHYGSASSDVSSAHGDGALDAIGYGLGATLTWYGGQGFYVDAVAQATWYDSDLSSRTAGESLVDGNDGFGHAFSLESGLRLGSDQGWSATPQAQLVYSRVDFDDFTDPFGAAVSLKHSDSLVGRLGFSVDRQAAWTDASGGTGRSHLYGIANIYYDFEDGSRVEVDGVAFTSENEALWGGIGLGGSLNLADDAYSLYGEALARTSLESFGDSYTLGGTVGFRIRL